VGFAEPSGDPDALERYWRTAAAFHPIDSAPQGAEYS